ncbi:MAG: helix-turn-helix transcriptional regulator [Spirochaetaceae bacterium]|nr:helix-turn-helix transcriptional regulator [Spirochaetaceae bacterium]
MNTEPETVRKTLSINMKRYRKLLGLSQEKLAEAAGLSSQTINDIEGCRMWVSDKTIAKLSDALHVEVYQLLISRSMQESPPVSSPEMLLDLQRNVKKAIDSLFDETLKNSY